MFAAFEVEISLDNSRGVSGWHIHNEIRSHHRNTRSDAPANDKIALHGWLLFFNSDAVVQDSAGIETGQRHSANLRCDVCRILQRGRHVRLLNLSRLSADHLTVWTNHTHPI